MQKLTVTGLLVCFFFFAAGQDRLLTVDDVFGLQRVGNPVVSPEGNWVAYTVSSTDLKKDKSETRIWMVPEAGGTAIAMTGKGYSASQPA